VGEEGLDESGEVERVGDGDSAVAMDMDALGIESEFKLSMLIAALKSSAVGLCLVDNVRDSVLS
jgi:hypothetical protein